MVGATRRDAAFAELPAQLVDRDDGMSALVCVDSEDHHGQRLPSRG